MSASAAHAGPSYPKSTIAWLTVGVLFLLYIRSLADRYLMALMVEPIKADLGLSDLQISLLQGPAFAVLYSICAVPVGLLLDRSSRRWVLFGCIVVWSAGAAACGLAASFAMLGIITAKETQDLKKIADAGIEIYKPTPAEFQQFVDATRDSVRKVLEENVDAVWFEKLEKSISEASK